MDISAGYKPHEHPKGPDEPILNPEQEHHAVDLMFVFCTCIVVLCNIGERISWNLFKEDSKSTKTYFKWCWSLNLRTPKAATNPLGLGERLRVENTKLQVY